MDLEMKEAWKKRAAWLNWRGVPGKFEVVPFELGGTQQNDDGTLLKNNVIEALTIQWGKVVRNLRSCLVNKRRNEGSGKKRNQRTDYFGGERVSIADSIIRLIDFDYLLKKVVFGNGAGSNLNFVTEF
mmetsp:Transcript_2642/g.3945  ORF Transcript_2642/g.3945 Transcript_2642/m.3945 type:complete len:128 (+) Transcript_2642:260-643(+)